ncbi:MAG: hypothetical protein ABSB91_10115 [Sedimentisphaerales bacterium]
MDYDEFADSFFSEVAKIKDNTLLIDGIKAQTMIKRHRQHAISFFNDNLEALKLLNDQKSEIVKSQKMLQLYDLLLFQIATYFEQEEHDTSYRERLTATMKQLARDNLQD